MFLSRSYRKTGYAGLKERVERSLDDPRGYIGLLDDLEDRNDHVVCVTRDGTIVIEGYDLFTDEIDARRCALSNGYTGTHTFFIDKER